jgi:hypothetical protein
LSGLTSLREAIAQSSAKILVGLQDQAQAQQAAALQAMAAAAAAASAAPEGTAPPPPLPPTVVNTSAAVMSATAATQGWEAVKANAGGLIESSKALEMFIEKCKARGSHIIFLIF